MQVRTKILLCVGILASVIVACAGLLLWNADRSTYNHLRLRLAYEELGGYLQLSGEVFRTFKQIRRDLMDGDEGLTFSLDAVERRINMIIAEIAADEAAELAVGARDDEDMGDVSRIEALRQELASAFADIRETERMLAAGRVADARAFLDASLETRIDSRVSFIIEMALADERGELEVASQEIEWMNRLGLWAAVAATATGLVLAGLAIFTLVLRLRKGLVNLEQGAALFATGRLTHEIPVSGNDEFAVLSRRFNNMARELRQQHQALEEARVLLERRVAERTDALRAANDELQRRDANRRQFFADIGHELRTPITAVRGEAEIALRTRQDHQETYRAALAQIIGIADQLTRFVNDIFLVAREQAGVLDLRREVTDLKKAVSAGVEQMNSAVDGGQALLTTAFDDGPALIEGDVQRLGQLVRILMSNAIQHSQHGVRIQVGLYRTDAGWELCVEDNGPGIPDSELNRVFERFYRAAVPDGTPSGGTGLGLPIARSLVNAHGGRIWIDSGRRRGTAVRAVFPALDESCHSAAVNDPVSEAGGATA